MLAGPPEPAFPPEPVGPPEITLELAPAGEPSQPVESSPPPPMRRAHVPSGLEDGLPKDLLWLREQFPELSAQDVFDAWSRFRQIRFSSSAGFGFLFIGIWVFVLATEKSGLVGASMVSAGTVLLGTAARFWGLSASGLAQILKASRTGVPRALSNKVKR